MPESERRLIQRIRRKASVGATGRGGAAVRVGIADDAAVLRLAPTHELLVTTDFSIENVHFRREWHAPEVVGWRCLTRGLSDIAAMGGEPIAAFLSLAVAADVPQGWVDQFFKGLLTLSRKFHVPLAGGDTAQAANGIQADIVVVGSIPRGTAILRSGARPGDHIYVTGALGGSAATLARLRASLPLGAEASRHFRPQARVRVGQWLRRHKIPSAMIDVSDGLSTDLEHICQESGVGAEIEAETIPRTRVGRGKNEFVALECALHGGDDYELLFTSSKPVPRKVEGVPITRIGRTTLKKGMGLIDADGKNQVLEAKGWEHFH
ncbi:MAG: thiamine-phosphate kinase [Terriglobales bacterium]